MLSVITGLCEQNTTQSFYAINVSVIRLVCYLHTELLIICQGLCLFSSRMCKCSFLAVLLSLVLPLYHQISGSGVPDAEQAITVVSPMPMRISLKATVTTGDSREEIVEQ